MNGGSDVAAKRVDLAYNNLDQVTGYTRYADLAGTELVATSAYTYDGQGRLTNLVHEQGTTQFADYEWTWDTLDRITAFTNSVWTAEDAGCHCWSIPYVIGRPCGIFAVVDAGGGGAYTASRVW